MYIYLKRYTQIEFSAYLGKYVIKITILSFNAYVYAYIHSCMYLCIRSLNLKEYFNQIISDWIKVRFLMAEKNLGYIFNL